MHPVRLQIVELAQRRNVIEDPERASCAWLRSNLSSLIHRSQCIEVCGRFELGPSPVITVIERHPDRGFRFPRTRDLFE